MEKALNYILGTLLVISIILNIVFGVKLSNSKQELQTTTVYVTDTLVRDSIQIQEKTKVRYKTQFDTVVISRVDTIIDSIRVEIPIEHKTYQDTIDKDSVKYNLRIDYSGFHPTLDYIDVNSTYKHTDISVVKQKHWRQYIGVGVHAGYGINLNIKDNTFGTGPYIGVGISYGFGYTW